MDLPQFQAELTKLERLPKLDHKHALVIGEHLSDADRDALLEKLRDVDGKLQQIHQGGTQAFEQAENLMSDVEKALNRFERQEAEQAERGSSLGSIDQQLSDHS